MLTNKPRSFKHSCVIETSLGDFHSMTVEVMKATFEKVEEGFFNMESPVPKIATIQSEICIVDDLVNSMNTNLSNPVE